MKKTLDIDGRKYFIVVNNTNEISFYFVESYIDQWNMKKENRLVVNDVGDTKNPTTVIRQILKELIDIVFSEKRDFYYFTPTDEKRKRIYLSYIEKLLKNDYTVQDTGNKLYIFKK